MDEISKYYCFNYLEFEVMRSIYRIESLMFFKPAYSGEERNAQDDYNKGFLGLYQKKYLDSADETWTVRDEVAKIFGILKEVSYTVSMVSKDEEAAEYLMFFSDREPEYFVVSQPGTQKEEYVKLRFCSRNKLHLFLEESGAVLPETISYELLKHQKIIPLEGGVCTLIKKKNTIKKEELWKEKDIATLFCIDNGGENQVMIGLIKQPLQDKIILCREGKTDIYIYSCEQIVQIMQDIMEAKGK